jgi:hypothetical protein
LPSGPPIESILILPYDLASYLCPKGDLTRVACLDEASLYGPERVCLGFVSRISFTSGWRQCVHMTTILQLSDGNNITDWLLTRQDFTS